MFFKFLVVDVAMSDMEQDMLKVSFFWQLTNLPVKIQQIKSWVGNKNLDVFCDVRCFHKHPTSTLPGKLTNVT